ncbi:MAG: hypothetical protein H7319_19325 [Spirosoma sp.]|nr:hypothetical protein [Spirosoma sp.]
MSTNLYLLSLLTLLALSGPGYGQAEKPVTNFLGIQAPIAVRKNIYQLAWSAHPDASLYKQEYLIAGDDFPKYKSMVGVDFTVTESSIDQAVDTKIRELENLKRTYPIVNYDVIQNPVTGEKIIDCLIGTHAATERDNLVERNVYRFTSARAKSGQRGILLLAVSVRKYGSEITPFLTRLKAEKLLLISEVAKLTMPTIQL